MDGLDPEIQAMATSAKAIEPLTEEARYRVINWLSKKFDAPVTTSHKRPPEEEHEDTDDSQEASFKEFAELFHAFNPDGDAERLIVGAYWHQIVEKNTSWYSVSINKLLKPTGYGIGKISRVLSAELKQRPARIIQLKRTGSNPQAKKACKLTDEGVRFVESRLKG